VAGAEHLRVLAFVSLPGDTATVLPWLFRSTVTPDGIRREREFSIAGGGGPAGGGGGSWEPLLADTVRTPLSRFPWRILPGGPVRMVVGPGDALQLLAFDDPPRVVELLPGEFLAEWTPEPGAAWRIHRARTVLPGGEVAGLLLDYNRSRGAGGPPPMDWIFLHAGPTAQFLFREGPGPGEDGTARGPDGTGATRWIGWSRVAFQERDWDRIQLRWVAVRPLERARRDVPAEWRLELLPDPAADTIPDDPPRLEGELRAVRSFLSVDPEAPGPVLPVAGFFEVEGEIRILGERFAVRGLVRHRQP
jgi:hypothetical protein